MNRWEMYAEFRERVGNVGRNDLSDDKIENYINRNLEFVASSLRYRVITDDFSMTLVASQREYSIPNDLAWMVWVEWNSNRLTPSSPQKWFNEDSDWRQATAANPSEYAIEGRKLILNPPGDSDAVTTDSILKFRYIAASGGMNDGGTPQLGDMDQQWVLDLAAAEWLVMHGDEKKAAFLQARANEWEDHARRRATNPHDRRHTGSYSVKTRRVGAAR